ncbi:MAG TPA: isochorismate synthase [Acidimicrobiia bacterium]|jgi:menaquinone-specific isochorismate synthase
MSAATPLVEPVCATTRRVDAPADLLDALGPDGVAWLHDGGGFVTSGVAARLEPGDAAAWLAAVDHDDRVGRPGTGPLAVGALPFDPTVAGELVVPRRILGRDTAGRAWLTEVGPPLGAPASRPRTAPATLGVRERMTHREWNDAVNAALRAIAGGELEKVVLARRVDVEADAPFDPRVVLGRLRAEQPECYLYAVDGMVGASPELLVRRRGRRVESRPMAGTALDVDEASVRALRTSAKDAREHRPVVSAIVETLGPWCDGLDVATAPDVARLASVAHLVTPVVGELHQPAPDAVALARALHPTPAVGGSPREPALAAIRRLEPCGRDRYAGPVGWVDARGDGEWVVALRGAVLDGPRAVLHAGAGIVAGSVPDDEWRETEAKLVPMLRALVRADVGVYGTITAVRS